MDGKKDFVISKNLKINLFKMKSDYIFIGEFYMFNIEKLFQKNTSGGNVFSYHKLSSPVWTKNNYDALIAEGFEKNVIAYRCINMISKGISSIPIFISCNNQRIDSSSKGQYKNKSANFCSNTNAQSGNCQTINFMQSTNCNNANDTKNPQNPTFNQKSKLFPTSNYYDDETADENCSTETEFEQIAALILSPNNTQTYASFIEVVVNYILLSGNVYILFNKYTNSLHILRPDRISIIPNELRTGVLKYKYSVDGMDQNVFSPSDILHIKNFNASDDWYGLSPLKVASQAIDQYNAVSNHNLSLLQNGGRPSGCLMIKNGIDHLSIKQKQQLREDISNTYQGVLNSGKIMILEGDFQWQDMGLSPKDMDFYNGKRFTACEIAQAFGVPLPLIGIESVAFANYKEARLHFWEDTVLPMADWIRGELNKFLSKIFNINVCIEFNFNKIPAISDKRERLFNMLVSADFLSEKEKREMLGYE